MAIERELRLGETVVKGFGLETNAEAEATMPER